MRVPFFFSAIVCFIIRSINIYNFLSKLVFYLFFLFHFISSQVRLFSSSKAWRKRQLFDFSSLLFLVYIFTTAWSVCRCFISSLKTKNTQNRKAVAPFDNVFMVLFFICKLCLIIFLLKEIIFCIKSCFITFLN